MVINTGRMLRWIRSFPRVRHRRIRLFLTRRRGAAHLVAEGATYQNRGDDPGRRGDQHIVTVDIGPVMAFRRGRQAAVAPVADAIFIATERRRSRVAFAEIVPAPGEMVLLMTCQIAFVMAVAIRATLVMVALMMRVRSALRCMPVMVRTVLLHRGLPRTMAVVRAIGKGRDAQHTG